MCVYIYLRIVVKKNIYTQGKNSFFFPGPLTQRRTDPEFLDQPLSSCHLISHTEITPNTWTVAGVIIMKPSRMTYPVGLLNHWTWTLGDPGIFWFSN